MFEISWSELLILAVVTLVFVGPKDMPVLFRTIGKYAGVLRRHANEFRYHFEEAMREAEMADLRKELDGVRDEFRSAASDVARSDTPKPAPQPAASVAPTETDGFDSQPATLPAPSDSPAPRPALPSEIVPVAEVAMAPEPVPLKAGA